jgi:hypothetical protein
MSFSCDSMGLRICADEVASYAYDRRVARLGAHAETEGASEPQHRLVGGEHDAFEFVHTGLLCVLDQVSSSRRPRPLSPPVRYHERNFGALRCRFDHVAPTPTNIQASSSDGKSHVTSIVDVVMYWIHSGVILMPRLNKRW